MASFARSARLALAFVHRAASPSRLSWLTFTPLVTPKNWLRVSSAAAVFAISRLACRWSFFFASRLACSASWKRNFARLLSCASSPVL